jgi:hypothetical protein
MSYGYYRPKKHRFVGMNLNKTVVPLPAVERVFRKTTEQETPPMDVIQKTLATTIVRKRGDISDEDVAKQHQALAMEMFPDSKNIGIALSKFYDTDVGKIALGYAASTKYAEIQKDCRCGDGDMVALAKVEREADKDDAGYVRGTRAKPKVRHADNDHAKKPLRATSHDGYSGREDRDPNRINNADSTIEARMAKCCDFLAEVYADEHSVSKNVAYSELLKTNKAFGMMWKAATALPASE